MPRATASGRKNPKPRKTTTEAEFIEVAPDIASLPDLSATQDEDVEDIGTGDLSRASSIGELTPSTSEPTPSTSTFVPPRKLPERVSHSKIPNYDFTDEELQRLRDFIKEHEELYVKTHRSYSNPYVKNDLWHECARLFTNCTYLQCRKLFEQRRTAFGKIEKAEMKSGSARRDRTQREEKLMEEWSFLRGQISHSGTTSSHDFTQGSQQGSPNESSSGDESAESGISAHSIERRRKKKMRRQGDVSAQDVSATQSDAEITSAIGRIVGQAATITTERNREPWMGSGIEHWSNFMASQVYELPAGVRDKAMMGAWSFVLGLKTPPNIADAVCQMPEQPAQQPKTQHLQHATTPVHPIPAQPTNVAPQPGPSGVIPAPPVPSAVIPAPTVQFNPTTPGQGYIYPWPAATTPTSIYHQLGPLQLQQPPITTYQHYQPTAQPSTLATASTTYQHYGHPAPSSSGYPRQTTAGLPPTPTTTSINVQCSQSLYSEEPTLQELQVYKTTASTLNTPRATDADDAAH